MIICLNTFSLYFCTLVKSGPLSQCIIIILYYKLAVRKFWFRHSNSEHWSWFKFCSFFSKKSDGVDKKQFIKKKSKMIKWIDGFYSDNHLEIFYKIWKRFHSIWHFMENLQHWSHFGREANTFSPLIIHITGESKKGIEKSKHTLKLLYFYFSN